MTLKSSSFTGQDWDFSLSSRGLRLGYTHPEPRDALTIYLGEDEPLECFSLLPSSVFGSSALEFKIRPFYEKVLELHRFYTEAQGERLGALEYLAGGEVLRLVPCVRLPAIVPNRVIVSPGSENRIESFTQGCALATAVEVWRLVAWLRGQSSKISATVSNEGLLSICADLDGNVELYVEVESDGKGGAAVVKDSEFALDVPGEHISSLTPEAILDAVRSF